MQHNHRHTRENWPLREMAIGGVVAVWLAVGSAFALSGRLAVGTTQPLVVENRYAVAAPVESQAKPTVSQPPVVPSQEVRQYDSVIDRLLAPATEGFENDAGDEPNDKAASEAEQLQSVSPVDEATPPQAEPESEPELQPPAEPVAEPETTTQAEQETERVAGIQAEPVAEAVESALTPWEAEETPSEPAAPPAETPPVYTSASAAEADMQPVESAAQPAESAVQAGEPPSAPWRPDMAPSEAWRSNADIRPVPPEPPAEMVDEMNGVWSEEFPSEPEPPYRGAAAATPYAPTVAELSAQLLPSVRKAYGLARHGAVYAARTEFIQVLRRIAQSKDAAAGGDGHSRALAVGLRALDEADDFVPQGTQLEGELNVLMVASAHRTPVLDSRHANVRPDEAIALYHHYAREQLARAVAGERAGSMALYGLGKVQNRLAKESDGELRHERRALVMFQAALDASPDNHLAANEIGVLFARGGQPVEASAMFRRAIDITPTSTTYHNLAVAERSLGQLEQAVANEKYARYLAARDRAAGNPLRRSGVEWVTPDDLSRVAQPLPISGRNGRVANDPRQAPRQPERLRDTSSPVQTVAKWPQKLVPAIFRR